MEPIKTNEQLLTESTRVAQGAANIIGGTFQQGVGFSPISSKTLSGNQTAINLPTPTPPSTTGVAITTSNLSNAEQAKANLDAEEQAYKEQVKETASKSTSKISELFGLQQKASEDKIAGYQTEEFKALKDLKTKALNDQISLRKAQDAEIEATKKNLAGLTTNDLNVRLNEISNRYAFQSAQLSLTSSIAQNNYNDAKSSIDDMYSLTMEKYKAPLDYYTQLAQNDQNIFNNAEVKILENKRDEYKTLQTQEADNTKQIGNLALEVAKNNAPVEVRQAVARAKTMEEAIGAAGSYVAPKKDRQTQIVEIGGSKSLIDSNTGEIIKTYGGNPVDASGLTPEQAKDPFVQELLKTKGGKNLTDTPLQQINKGLTVLGQLGALQTNINNTKTGPILGAFKGANPWDTNAQTIKAQLNAVVPNLARGIYGEVGVLTDNDIKTYSSTIGNLKSTNDVNNAIMYITLDLIGKSITNTLSVQAAGGRDVSGFVDIYTEMQKTKNSILQSLPQPENTANNNPFLTVLGGSTSSSTNNIWNPTTGVFNIPSN